MAGAARRRAVADLSLALSAVDDVDAILDRLASTAADVIGARGIEVTVATAHDAVAGASELLVPLRGPDDDTAAALVVRSPKPPPDAEAVDLLRLAAELTGARVEAAWLRAAAARRSRRLAGLLAAPPPALRSGHVAEVAERLNRVAAGVAHEFNNLLTVARGHAELATELAEGPAPMLREVVAAVDEAGELAQRLLASSSQQALEPAAVDVERTACAVVDLLAGAVGERYTLRVEPDGAQALALVDAVGLEQAVFDLLVNACDAMPEGGTVTVRTSMIDGEARTDLEAGRRYRCVTVVDEGSGMDDDALRRALEPFFTTKGPDGGAGLGLPSAWGLARQCGGTLALRSAPGQGTEVDVVLPLAEEPQR